MKKWWPFLLSSHHHHRRLQDPIGDKTQILTFYFPISFLILLDNIRLFAPKKENCIVICALKMEDVLCYQGDATMNGIMQEKTSNPRMLFDVESPVLLVSKVYKCEHGHDIPAGYFHDTSEDFTCVPFVLTHRSGMTMRLSNEIEDLLDRGLAISSVEERIKETYKRTLRNRLLRFLNDAQHAKELGFTQSAEELNFDVPGNLFPGQVTT